MGKNNKGRQRENKGRDDNHGRADSGNGSGSGVDINRILQVQAAGNNEDEPPKTKTETAKKRAPKLKQNKQKKKEPSSGEGKDVVILGGPKAAAHQKNGNNNNKNEDEPPKTEAETAIKRAPKPKQNKRKKKDPTSKGQTQKVVISGGGKVAAHQKIKNQGGATDCLSTSATDGMKREADYTKATNNVTDKIMAPRCTLGASLPHNNNNDNKAGAKGLKPATKLKKNGTNKKAEVTLLGRGTAKNGLKMKSDHPEVTRLKQQLFESTRDLEKENNTRKMLEDKLKRLNLELKTIKEKLGEDKHYCISTLKSELEFEQKLRLSLQKDLSKSNDMIVSEQKKMTLLEKEIEREKRGSDSIRCELQAAMQELGKEKALQNSNQIELSSEKQKTRDLQIRLQYEVASKVAVRMELRRGQAQVAKLEEELRLERQTTGQSKVDVAAHTAVRMELQAANEKLQHKRHLDNKLKQEKKMREVEELTPSRSASFDCKEGERNELIRKLKRELHTTRAELKNERRKKAASVSLLKLPKKIRPKRSLSEWVEIAPTNNRQHAGLIPILQSPRTTSMPPPIEASLPGSSTESSPPSSSPPESAFSSLFHFDDDDVSVMCDKDMEPLHDELTFIKSAYDPDEIVIEENRVTHLIELSTDNDSEIVSLALTVYIPSNYPSGVLSVKASIKNSDCSHEVRKCAIDALPELEEICTWEAKANKGQVAIHEVFSVASGWANTDWHNLLSKEMSSTKERKEEFYGASAEICVSLIHTHHLIEADKIQSVRKNASKLSLGGFVKIGKPGLILVEGTEADCDNMLDALVQCKKIFHSSTFKFGGKVLRKVSDVDACRSLPRKMEQLESKNGMDELNSVCEELGLSQSLNDITSH